MVFNMGIINMMIVIPMLIYSLTFGHIFNSFLNMEPVNAIYFGAVFLVIASILTLFIKTPVVISDDVVMPVGGALTKKLKIKLSHYE